MSFRVRVPDPPPDPDPPAPTATPTPTPTATPRPGQPTLPKPPRPSQLSVGTPEKTKIQLTWKFRTGIEEYRVEYKLSTASEDDWIHWGDVSGDQEEGAIGSSAPEDGAEGQTLDVANITGLTCETTYNFRVRAYGDGSAYAADWGPWATQTGTTADCPDETPPEEPETPEEPTPTPTPTPTAAPPPSDLDDAPLPDDFAIRPSRVSDEAAVATWTTSIGVKKYEVQYRMPNEDWRSKTYHAGASGARLTIGGLEADEPHQFMILAYGDGTRYEAEWSDPSSVVTATPGRPTVSVALTSTSALSAGAEVVLEFTANRRLDYDLRVSTAVGDSAGVMKDSLKVVIPSGSSSVTKRLDTHSGRSGRVVFRVVDGAYARAGSPAELIVTVTATTPQDPDRTVSKTFNQSYHQMRHSDLDWDCRNVGGAQDHNLYGSYSVSIFPSGQTDYRLTSMTFRARKPDIYEDLGKNNSVQFVETYYRHLKAVFWDKDRHGKTATVATLGKGSKYSDGSGCSTLGFARPVVDSAAVTMHRNADIWHIVEFSRYAYVCGRLEDDRITTCSPNWTFVNGIADLRLR